MGYGKQAALVRRTGLANIDPFFRDFLHDSLKNSGHWLDLFGAAGMPRTALARWAPAMELSETDEGYAVTVELPGTKAEDIQVECHEHRLTVKGEKRSERDEANEHRHYTERTFGSFSRMVSLPPDAADDVNAKFSDGVLTIEIPKVEEKKPRAVAIKS